MQQLDLCSLCKSWFLNSQKNLSFQKKISRCPKTYIFIYQKQINMYIWNIFWRNLVSKKWNQDFKNMKSRFPKGKPNLDLQIHNLDNAKWGKWSLLSVDCCSLYMKRFKKNLPKQIVFPKRRLPPKNCFLTKKSRFPNSQFREGKGKSVLRGQLTCVLFSNCISKNKISPWFFFTKKSGFPKK